MQINTKKTGAGKFKPTKRELGYMHEATALAELIARNADGEPIGDAALKAVEGLQALVELLNAVEVEAAA